MIQFANTPQMIEFIPANWLELSAQNPELRVFSRPVDTRYLHPHRNTDQWESVKLSAESSAVLSALAREPILTTRFVPVIDGAPDTTRQLVGSSIVCVLILWYRQLWRSHDK